MEIIQDPDRLRACFTALELMKRMPWAAHYPWRLLRFQRGEYLCRYGETVPLLLLLLEGRVTVSLTPGHGRTHLVTWCEPGQLICGDVETALDTALATADLRAEEGGVLCAGIGIAAHRETLMSDVEFLRYTVRRLSQKMIKDSVYAANNLLFPLEDRLAAYLLSASGDDGVFRGNLTRTAELLGVSYRQLSRVMRSFTALGRVERTREGWALLDRAALERQAADTLPLALSDSWQRAQQ